LDPYSFYAPGEPAADVPADAAFTPWRLPVLSQLDFDAMSVGGRLSEPQLAYLAAFNLLAPTSHNTVPQRFVIEPRAAALTIVLDRTAVLDASDVHGRQAAVSIGCGIANTVAAGRCYGLVPRVEMAPVEEHQTRPFVKEEPRYTTIADIAFERRGGPSLSHRWLSAMVSRKVVRAEYDARVALGADLQAALDAWMRERHPAIELHWIVDTPTKLFIGKCQEAADTTVVNREAFATELGAWLLDNDASACVGMRGREFGLDDDASRRIGRGLRGEIALLPDELAAFAKSGNVAIRSASAVAVLSVEQDSVEARVRAGWAYEDLALQLAQHAFVTAMHAGITEIEGLNRMLRGRLRTARRPTVVFRAGKPLLEESGRRPHSSRPDLSALIL
jgi:hypothetical protein